MLPALPLSVSAPVAIVAPADKCDAWVRASLSSPSVSGRVRVVVRLKDGNRAAQESALRRLGGDIYRRLALVDSVALSLPHRQLSRLAGLGFVERVSSDVRVVRSDAFTVEHSLTSSAWSGYGVNGSGVTVAVLDSGIDSSHPDLSGRVLKSVGFVAGGADPADWCGHGTHVAGIVAGSGAASSGWGAYQTFTGVAPKANLVNVRVLDALGHGNVSDALAGLQWVYDNRAALKIRVLNMSFGHAVGEPYTTDPLCQAVEKLWKAGIVVVCAAGNDGRTLPLPLDLSGENEGYGTSYGSIQSPGNDPYVLTVGAMKQTGASRSSDRIASYSSRGPSRLDFVLKPDLVAPGNKVVSSRSSLGLPTWTPETWVSNAEYRTGLGALGVSTTYQRLSGTSMATPVVSGAAALLLQKYPGLTPDTVKARLMLTADKWLAPDGSADPCAYGAGFLNVKAALGSNAIATRPALSPTLLRQDDGGVRILTDNLIGADRVIWGVSGVSDLRMVWGDRVIWGNSGNLLSGALGLTSSALWMDRVIWGNSTLGIDLNGIVLLGE